MNKNFSYTLHFQTRKAAQLLQIENCCCMMIAMIRPTSSRSSVDTRLAILHTYSNVLDNMGIKWPRQSSPWKCHRQHKTPVDMFTSVLLLSCR